MKFLTILLTFLILILSNNLIAQDQFHPIGCDSYEGPITCGGDAILKVVSTVSDLRSSLKSNSVVHLDGIFDLGGSKLEL